MPTLKSSLRNCGTLLSAKRLANSYGLSWTSPACAALALAALLPDTVNAWSTQNSSSPSSEPTPEATDQENADSGEPAAATPFALIELPADLRRWLDEVETLSERGDSEGAQRHLSDLISSDVYAALLTSDDTTALSGLDAIIAVALRSGFLNVEGTAREEQVRRLSAGLNADHPDLLRAKESLAVTRYQLGNLESAAKLLEKVHASRDRLQSPDDPGLLGLKQNLAVMRYGLGGLEGARQLLEQVHAAREGLLPPDHPDLLKAKSDLAAVRSELGDLTGALELIEQVHEVRARLLPPDDLGLLHAKSNLGVIRRELGDLAGAHELFELVHATRARLLHSDHPDLLGAKLNLAVTRSELGDLAGALELEEQLHAAQKRQLSPGHPDLLVTKQNLAATRSELGDLSGALELEVQVLAARERLLSRDHPDLLSAKQNLAVTFRKLGDLAGALELEVQVLEARERLLPPDHLDLLSARFNLAGTRSELGDLVSALELFELVHTARARLLAPDHPDLLDAKSSLAVTRSGLGDLTGAQKLFELVHTARERLLSPDHPSLLRAKQNLAANRSELGDLVGALELEQQVHEARERLLLPDHPDLLSAKQNLAVTRRELGDLAGALELEERVHAARERQLLPDHHDLLRAKLNLAVTRFELGDLAGSMELTVAILQGQVIRARALRLDAPRVARASAGTEFRRLSKCLSINESKKTNANANASFKLEPELFAAIESLRSVSIGSPAVMSAATQRPELARLLAERRRVRGALGDLQLAAPGIGAEDSEIDAWQIEIVQLSEERDFIERAVRLGLAEAGFDEALPTVVAAAAGLDSNALLVDFFRNAQHGSLDSETGQRAQSMDSLIALVVTPAGDVHRVELGASADVERLVVEWNGRIGQSVGRGVGIVQEGRSDVEVARRLRERLLDPCLAVVGGELPEKLHIVLDDFLYLLPFDALIWKDGKRLGEVCEVRGEVTAQRLTTNAGPYSGDGKLLALGGVDFSAKDVEVPQGLLASATPPMGDSYRSNSSRPGDFGGLAQSRVEVEALEMMFKEMQAGKSVVLTGAKASKKALFEGAPSARYLHIATHGWFAPETFASTRDSTEHMNVDIFARFGRAEETLRGYAAETLCGLALAGANEGLNSIGKVPGIITAEELSALDLGNCELAVLSACETNVGIRRAGQGIQSLQTALHAAGVRTAITTLWRVDDAAARRLMELFYTKLWRDELPKAKALWQAKMEMRAEGFAVKDWAGWVMTGDPR